MLIRLFLFDSVWNAETTITQRDTVNSSCARRTQLKRLADEIVTIGKDGTLFARRRAQAILRTEDSIRKVFTVLAERYRDRTGGYTRVLRCFCSSHRGHGARLP